MKHETVMKSYKKCGISNSFMVQMTYSLKKVAALTTATIVMNVMVNEDFWGFHYQHILHTTVAFC